MSAQESGLPKTIQVERPLTGIARFTLSALATGAIAGFYIFCLVAIVLISALLIIVLLVFLGLGRFGMSNLMTPSLQAQSQLLMLILRSFGLKRAIDYYIKLERSDASRFYDMVEELALVIGVQPPDEIRLEMTSNAWVRLRGYRKGKGHTLLGMGYMLLVALSEAEVRAIVAHELAHAKLVQRGYSGWLVNGILRQQQLAIALGEMLTGVQGAGKRFVTATLVQRVVLAIARRAAHLVAASSRQDEFAADALGALVCKNFGCRSALINSAIIGLHESGITRRDCLVHFQREGSFSEWMRSRLVSTEEKDRAEMEKSLLEMEMNPLDTHPSIADRLAALPPEESSNAMSCSALQLLDDPDETVTKLIRELERIVAEEERKESERLGRWARKEFNPTLRVPINPVGLVVIVVGGVLFILSLGAGFDTATIVIETVGIFVSLAIVVAGVLVCWIKRPRESLPLPVPALVRVMDSKLEARPLDDLDSWVQRLRGEMRSQLPAKLPKGGELRFWNEKAYSALADCDFRRSYVAARESVSVSPHALEGLLSRGICEAFFGMTDSVRQTLSTVLDRYGTNRSTSWGLGWAFYLLSDWAIAEPFLHNATGYHPEQETIWSVLGLCQWGQGKTAEATRSFQEALRLQSDNDRARLCLVQVYLAAGLPRNALKELEKLSDESAAETDAQLESLRANLLLGRTDEGKDLAQAIERTAGANALVRIGHAFREANLPSEAGDYFERSLRIGHIPEALWALAGISYENKDFTSARSYLHKALDVTAQVPDDVTGPLEFLNTICEGLRIMAEPLSCRAWNVRIDLTSSPGKARQLFLLVCENDENAMKEQVRWLCGGMYPGQLLDDAHLSWELLSPDEQPSEPIPPGIYDARVN